MTSKTLLITGGNSGLGFATVQALLSSSTKTEYTIILCSRSQQKADEAIEKLQKEHQGTKSKFKGMILDYASDESIAALASKVEKEVGKLDILVNNGGAQLDPQFYHGKSNLTERQMWNETWNINVTGPFLLSNALMPSLLKSRDPRIVFITSGLSSFEWHLKGFNSEVPKGWPKTEYTGPTAYRSAKTGLNQMMIQLQRIVRDDGVKVITVSPGYLMTGLGDVGAENMKKLGAIPVEQGAEVVRGAIEGERDADAEKGVVNKDGNQAW